MALNLDDKIGGLQSLNHNEDQMKKNLPLISLFLITIAAPAIFAQTRPHIVDQNHSQINFVAEARFISAHGYFDKWDAEVQLDPAKIENSSFKITIDAASINTRVAMRDNHLRSKDFFDVATYPQITLVSKKITKTGDRTYAVSGDLTLHGVTKQLDVEITEVFYENNRGRFRASFRINRKAFGINYDSKMNPIEDVVQVQVDINVLDKEATEKARAAKSGSN
jgi:polyisoprenoid-binding protein YceI